MAFFIWFVETKGMFDWPQFMELQLPRGNKDLNTTLFTSRKPMISCTYKRNNLLSLNIGLEFESVKSASFTHACQQPYFFFYF